MAFKFLSIFALIATCSAEVLDYHHGYSDAPSVSYSSISSPVATHGSPSYAAPVYKLAVPVSYAAPVAKTAYAEPSASAHYDFSYGVEDPHTGDVKGHQETRNGDVTKGSYFLIEADGSKRIVEYSVDAHSGFNAVVHKEPAQGHGRFVAPHVAKVGYAVPAIKVAAPLTYAAPVLAKIPAFAKVSYSSAPEVSYSSVSAPAAHDGHSYYH